MVRILRAFVEVVGNPFIGCSIESSNSYHFYCVIDRSIDCLID